MTPCGLKQLQHGRRGTWRAAEEADLRYLEYCAASRREIPETEMSIGFLVWLPLFTASRQAQSRHRFKSQTRARTSFASASYRLVGDRIRDIIGKGRTIDTIFARRCSKGRRPPSATTSRAWSATPRRATRRPTSRFLLHRRTYVSPNARSCVISPTASHRSDRQRSAILPRSELLFCFARTKP